MPLILKWFRRSKHSACRVLNCDVARSASVDERHCVILLLPAIQERLLASLFVLLHRLGDLLALGGLATLRLGSLDSSCSAVPALARRRTVRRVGFVGPTILG